MQVLAIDFTLYCATLQPCASPLSHAAQVDGVDNNGHGTHVMGSLLGSPFDVSNTYNLDYRLAAPHWPPAGKVNVQGNPTHASKDTPFSPNLFPRVKHHTPANSTVRLSNGLGKVEVCPSEHSGICKVDPHCWLRGLAPDAKVAFVDLADSHSGGIYTPQDLSVHYYPLRLRSARPSLNEKHVGLPSTQTSFRGLVAAETAQACVHVN